jgi:ubiquitin C
LKNPWKVDIDRCSALVEIDGNVIGKWIVRSDKSLIIERPANQSQLFTFLRSKFVLNTEKAHNILNLKPYAVLSNDLKFASKSAPVGSGIIPGKVENGLIKVTYTPAKIIILFVRTMSGKSISLKTNSNTTIKIIKEMILAKEGILEKSYYLSFNRKRLLSSEKPYYNCFSTSGKKYTLEMISEQIFIKNLSGKTLTFNVDLYNCSVEDIKILIENAEGIPINKQRLLYEGKPLEDGLFLIDYNIRKESTLHLMLCLRGGGINTIDEDDDDDFLSSPFSRKKQKIDDHIKKINAAEGATTLQGKSKQVFHYCDDFEGDETKAIEQHVWLVCDADEDIELIFKNSDVKTKPTALKSAAVHFI